MSTTPASVPRRMPRGTPGSLHTSEHRETSLHVSGPGSAPDQAAAGFKGPRAVRSGRASAPRLRPDQVAVVECILRRDRLLDLSEPGTGKTPVELTAIARTVEDGGTSLLVVPAPLLQQIEEEALLWTPQLGRPRQHQVPTPEHPFSITTHQRLARLLPELRQTGLELLVIDEAHVMATTWPNPSGLRKALGVASRLSEKVLLTTGTPVDCVAALDLMGLMQAAGIITQSQWEQLLAEVEFNTFDPAKPIPMGISQQGTRALQAILKSSAVRTRLDDLQAALPQVRTRISRLSLTPAQLSSQEQTYRHYSGLARARRLADIGRDAERLAVRAFHWKCLYGASHTHTLVLTERREVVKALHDEFLAGSEPVHVLTGETSQRERQRMLSRHRAEGGILIASEVGGTGLNFQYCSLLIEVGTTWEAEKARQRLGRILRPGSPHEEVTHLRIFPKSADEVQRAERRDKKSRLARELMNCVPGPVQALALLDHE